MSLNRSDTILKYIVEYFIKHAQPVGSQTLIDEYHLPYSSATIRNEMFALEKMELIEKTHSSSGRVPSAKGYKYYCDKLRDNSVDEALAGFGDKIEIEVNEKSRVFALYKKRGDDGQFHKYWEQIYAGTTHSKFSFKPIIKERERLKLSQKEVAEKADINLRSYQRMEAGESIPDALGLIALMNLLDIKNVDTFNRKCRFIDDDYSKFRSGNNPSEFQSMMAR